MDGTPLMALRWPQEHSSLWHMTRQVRVMVGCLRCGARETSSMSWKLFGGTFTNKFLSGLRRNTHFWHVLDHAAHALGEHVVGPVADRTNNRVYYITPTCADSSRRLGRKLTVWKAGRRSA